MSVELLSPHQLVVLGYYPVPDQTSTDQARGEFGAEATDAIEAIAARFAQTGGGAEPVVVFTHDRSTTIDNVAVLLRESDATVTVFNVAESDEEASRGELVVRGACDRLKETTGVDPARIDWRQGRDSSATDAIAAAAEDYDLLTVGESKPSLTERILGDVTDKVIDRSSDPLLIVRNR